MIKGIKVVHVRLANFWLMLVLAGLPFWGLAQNLNGLGAAFRLTTLEVDSPIWVNSYLTFIPDFDSSLDEQQVLEMFKQGAGIRFDSYPHALNPDYTYWGKIELENQAGAVFQGVLYTGWNDFVEVYKLGNGPKTAPQLSGELIPEGKKDVPIGKKSKVSLNLLPQEKCTLLIKIRRINGEKPVFDLKILSQESWYYQNLLKYTVQGLFQGGLWIMILYNLFIFLGSRDWPYGYYSLYLFFASIFFAHYFNLSAAFLLPNLPRLNAFLWLSSAGMSLCYYQFLRSFLHTQKIDPPLDRLLLYFIRAMLLAFLLELAQYIVYFNFVWTLHIHNHVLLLEGLVGIYVLYRLLQFKNPTVGYFIIGSGLLAIGGIIATCCYLYFADYEAIYFAQVGILGEIILFSMGLGARIKILEAQKRQSQLELIYQLSKNEQLQKNLNRRLGHMVKSRTAELETQKDQLKKLNGIKDKLFSVISHDLRSPLTSLQGTLKVLSMDLLNAEEKKEVHEMLEAQLHYTKSLLDNLLHWASIQKETVHLQLVACNLHDLVKGVLQSFEEVNYKHIQLLNQIPPHLEAYLSPDLTRLVLRNLIDNAIKFTHRDGKVEIAYTLRKECICLQVRDTGVGISEKAKVKLFQPETHFTTLGTEKEKGTGLGLLLCKEFIEKQGGEIWVESEKFKGTTISFTLPKPEGNRQDPKAGPYPGYIVLE